MGYNNAMKLAARVSDKYFLTENERFLLVKLELVEPDRIEFRAGQYVSLKVNESGERRSYSIVTTPDNNHGLSLLAEMVKEGKGSEYLRGIELGSEVEIVGPLGKFTVTEEDKRLFVASGSGIVPIMSMINDLLLNQHEKKSIRLHWGMRSEADLFWVDNLERLSEAHPNFVFDIVLSKPSEAWELCSGHVQDCLKRDFSQEGLGGWSGYVCGSPKMVESTTQELEKFGITADKIYN